MKNMRLLLINLCLLVLAGAPALAANYGGPGLHPTTLFAGRTIDAGTVSVWNSPKKLMIQVESTGDWSISEVNIYVGYPDINPLPATNNGNPKPGRFPYKKKYRKPRSALLYRPYFITAFGEEFHLRATPLSSMR